MNTLSKARLFSGFLFLAVLCLSQGSSLAAWAEYERMYQASSGDHFYTASQADVAAAKTVNYYFETYDGFVQTTSETGTQPLYKLFNTSTGEHLLTTNTSEYNALSSPWIKEGVSAYIATSQTADTMPLHRFNLTGGKHFYTTKQAEKDLLISHGHSYEGIIGYTYKKAPVIVPTYQYTYPDNRPAPSYRLSATDAGQVLQHGDTADVQGARDAFIYEEDGTYYMTYDGANGTKWSVNMATSTNLTNWTKIGSKLSETTSCGCYGTIFKKDGNYYMYYLGSNSQQEQTIPVFPYYTRLATSTDLTGTGWSKQGNVFNLQGYYDLGATPGPIIEENGEYLMFFTAGHSSGRAIGIARADDPSGPWTTDSTPIIPHAQQVENISVYKQDDTWFLFTNHIGLNGGGEYSDSIWVYWTTDLANWNTNNKAVVVDGGVSTWSHTVIGLPSVVKVGNKLAILYDGLTGTGQGHLNRDIGLAWVDLPIQLP